MPKSSLLGRPAVKKLLLAYIVAMILVIAYFVLRTLFQEQKQMGYLEFNSHTKESAAEHTESAPAIAEKKFILLPR